MSEEKQKRKKHYDYESIAMTVKRLSKLLGMPISVGYNRSKYFDIEMLAIMDIACLLHSAAMGYGGRRGNRRTIMRMGLTKIIDESVAQLYDMGWTAEDIEKQKRRRIGTNGKENYYQKAIKLRTLEAQMMKQYQDAYTERLAMEPDKPEREIKRELYEPAADGIPEWCDFGTILDEFRKITPIIENAGWDKYIRPETEKDGDTKG